MKHLILITLFTLSSISFASQSPKLELSDFKKHCMSEIEQICKGQDDNLRKCFKNNEEKLSKECRRRWMEVKVLSRKNI